MGDYRDDEYDEMGEGELNEIDEQERLWRIEERDDFASFDPSAYMRRRRGGLDEEREEMELDPRYPGRRSALEGGALAAGLPRRRRRSSAGRASGAIPETYRAQDGIFGLLTTGLAPGIRLIALSFGCLLVVVVVGVCAVGLWLIGLLTSR